MVSGKNEKKRIVFPGKGMECRQGYGRCSVLRLGFKDDRGRIVARFPELFSSEETVLFAAHNYRFSAGQPLEPVQGLPEHGGIPEELQELLRIELPRKRP
jgi:hypothetical protein